MQSQPADNKEAFYALLETEPHKGNLEQTMASIVENESKGDRAKVAEFKRRVLLTVVRQSSELTCAYELAFGPLPG